MTSLENNPSFPVITGINIQAIGLTKLEFFTALAMQAYIASNPTGSDGTIARCSVDTAKATLKLLEDENT